MLQIKSIDDLRQKVACKEEIREFPLTDGYSSASDEQLTCFCYMIAGDNTFDDSWSRECRGIVFNRAGKVCARPPHKFFNLGERESTQVENIDWSKVYRVMDKRDGSLIHTVKVRKLSHPGTDPVYDVKLKSKKSFESDVAKAASRWATSKQNVSSFLKKMIELDVTAIFEWTAPDARIVLQYNEPELQLLHIRDNEDGNYWSLSALKELAAEFNVKVVDEIEEFWLHVEGVPTTREFDVDRLLDAAKTRENIEGWVIQFHDGDMIKVKTEWYLVRHKSFTFLRERDIAELVLAGGLDDLKALLVGDGVNISEILDIEQRVIDDIRNIERITKSVARDEDFKLDRKEFVFKHREKAGQYFGLLMNLYSGKVPNYKEFFEKHIFKQQYGLRQLMLIPSVAEIE